MNKIKVFLKNKKGSSKRLKDWFSHKSKMQLVGGQALYVWEFEQAVLEPNQYYYRTKKNLYSLFVNHDGFSIGQMFFLFPNKETNDYDRHWASVEKELGIVKIETFRGDFWFK